MIWEQMELRGKTVEALMDEMFGQTDMDGEEEGEGGEFDDEDEGEYGGAGSEEEESQEEEEDDGEEPPTPEEEEYFRRLAGGLEEEEPSEDEEEDDEEDDEEEEDEDEAPKKKQKKDKVAPDADGNRDLTLDNFDGENGKKRARARRFVHSLFLSPPHSPFLTPSPTQRKRSRLFGRRYLLLPPRLPRRRR